MRTIWAVLDRTAVLAVGVAAGVAIGLSFHTGEGAGPPDLGVPPPSAPAGTPAAITPAGPGAVTAAPAPPLVQNGSKPASAPPAGPPPAAPAVPAVPVTPQVLAHAPSDGTVRVGVFGDSFGDGVWAALYHQLGKGGFKVFKFSQEGTGFTRYRSLNLEDRARGQLAGQPIDVAVISFGANDVQGVFGDDGHVYALMSPGWQRTIGDRVTRFVNQIRSTGAQVYWIGLPVMRKPDYDRDIQAMNAFYARLMGSLGVPFVDTRPLTVGADGGYAPYLPDASGAPRLMRAGDGIHMSMNGYERLTGGVAQRIRSFGDTVRARNGAPAPVAAPPVASTAVAPIKPAPATKATPKPKHADSETAAPATNTAPSTLAAPPARAPLNLPELEDRGRAEPQPVPAPSLLPPALAAPDNGAAPADKPKKKRKHDGDATASPDDKTPGRP